MFKTIEKLKNIAIETKRTKKLQTLEDIFDFLAEDNFCGEILIFRKNKSFTEKLLEFRTFNIDKHAVILNDLKDCNVVNVIQGQYPVAPPIDFIEIYISVDDKYLRDISKESVKHIMLNTKMFGCIYIPVEKYDEYKDYIVESFSNDAGIVVLEDK